jgi:hypothetical protein
MCADGVQLTAVLRHVVKEFEMNLSPKDLDKLHTLVLTSIVNAGDLKALVSEMRDIRFDEIVNRLGGFEGVVYELLQWLERHGRTAEFITVLIKNRPNQRKALAPLLQAATRAEKTVPQAEPETASLDQGAPPRYTDIQIFNQKGELQEERSPLVGAQVYTLDVAIRAIRKGYTKDLTDQEPVTIIGQAETVRVWVVVTDETDSGSEKDDNNESEGRLFTFSYRFADLQLPVVGDSEGSARFEFSADRKVLHSFSRIRPQIGVRLYYKLNLIDHVQLDLRVEATLGELSVSKNEPAIKVTFKHPSRKTGIEFPDSKSATRALNISISKIANGDQPDLDAYLFSFVVGDESGKPILSGTKKLPESTLNDYAAKFRAILLDTVFGPSLVKVGLRVGERDDLLRELSLLGTKIVTELFDYAKSKPTDLFQVGKMVREALAGTSSEISIIQISLSKGAEDFVFPWQVLTLADYIDGDARADPENLWGYHFIIEVKRCGDGTDKRAPATGTELRYESLMDAGISRTNPSIIRD